MNLPREESRDIKRGLIKLMTRGANIMIRAGVVIMLMLALLLLMYGIFTRCGIHLKNVPAIQRKSL